MGKIQDQKQVLQDCEDLIRKQQYEINKLRNIVYRYYIEHGEVVKRGEISVNDNIDFNIKTAHFHNENFAMCNIIDHTDIEMKSNYQRIKSEFEKLLI